MVMTTACVLKGLKVFSPLLNTSSPHHKRFLHIIPASINVKLQVGEKSTTTQNFSEQKLLSAKTRNNLHSCRHVMSVSNFHKDFIYNDFTKRHYKCSVTTPRSPSVSIVHKRHMAGHSKFANIKHRKEAQDSARSDFLAKMMGKLRVAIKEGGSDPKKNSQLAAVIEIMKKQNTPNDKIESYVKKMSDKSKSCADHLIEVRGVGNSVFIVQVYAESPKQAVNVVNILVKKTHATVVPNGSVTHFFEKKGTVNVKLPLEKLDVDPEEIAIECGAEDVTIIESEEEGNMMQFTCEAEDVLMVKKELLGLGHDVMSHETTFTPLSPITPSEEERTKIDEVISKLQENEDVSGFYVNL